MTASKRQPTHKITVATYVVGFVISLALTITAYLLVVRQLAVGGPLIVMIVSLAIGQLLAQLFFFLHLGRETKPRWKLAVFWLMLIVLAILVVGSLWIMQNLNYHMMSGHELDNYIIQDEGIHQ